MVYYDLAGAGSRTRHNAAHAVERSHGMAGVWLI